MSVYLLYVCLFLNPVTTCGVVHRRHVGLPGPHSALNMYMPAIGRKLSLSVATATCSESVAIAPSAPEQLGLPMGTRNDKKWLSVDLRSQKGSATGFEGVGACRVFWPAPVPGHSSGNSTRSPDFDVNTAVRSWISTPAMSNSVIASNVPVMPSGLCSPSDS